MNRTPLERKHLLLAAGLIVGYVVVQQLWPSPIGAKVQGALLGLLSALIAVGLALVYRANRIINFAQASLAAMPATFAVSLVTSKGWPIVPTFVMGLLFAGLVGAVVQRLVIQRFSRAPRLILTVATIGLSQILVALSSLLTFSTFGDQFRLAGMPEPISVEVEFGSYVFNGHSAFALVVSVLVLAGVFLLLERTSLGIAIRASAENRDRAALLGVPIRRVQMAVWVVAAVVAYVGVFLRAGTLGAQTVLTGGDVGPKLFAVALAAAIVGRMERLGVIVAASVGIGVVEQSIYWHTLRATDTYLVLFLIVLGALLFQQRGSLRADDSLRSAWKLSDVPRPVPTELRHLPEVRWATRGLAIALGVILVSLPAVLSAGRTGLAAIVLVYAVLGLSVVVLTGWAGQISLGQAAFFGIGAAVSGAMSLHGWDPVVSMLVAGAVSAVAAVVVGVPALRIQGLFLAAVTAVFSVTVSNYVLNPEISHWVPVGEDFVPRNPLFGRIDVGGEVAYYYVCLAWLAIAMWLVRGLRTGRLGRALLALRDNERAAQSYGVNAVRAKLAGFAVSGFLAGTAGSLYLTSQQVFDIDTFSPTESLQVLLMVVIGGTGSIAGALIGSLYINGTQWFSDLFPVVGPSRLIAQLLPTGFGVVFVLLVLPGGLGSALFRFRDRLLRRLADRHDIVVPSLVADSDDTVADAPPAIERRGREIRDERPVVLEISNLDAGYDGVQVIFGVDLEVREGEIVALLGTNGAGKSTVLGAITGLVDRNHGSVHFEGQPLPTGHPELVAGRGIVHMPGGKAVFPGLSVRENLRIAGWTRRHDPAGLEQAIASAIETFPILGEKADLPGGDLSGGQQQMLSLAQAFIMQPRLLMIDELSLGLAPVIVEQLAGIVRQMRDDGTTIVIVEQSVNVALTIADRAYFLEKGRVRFEGPTADLLDRPDVLRSVFLDGVVHDRDESDDRRADGPGPVILSLDGVTRSFGGVVAVDDVSLEVRRGEILGIIGANGAGKTTLFDLISGFLPLEAGRVVFDGLDVTRAGPARRAMLGLGRSFQDARLFSSLSVAETIALSFERALPFRDPIASMLHLPEVQDLEADIRDEVEVLIELLNLGALRNKLVSELSTGSRRIVDVACVMAHEPTVLLLDEPSSGLGQKETEALAPLIQQIQRDTGATILVIEHDMPLISEVSDELVAMHLGAVLARGRPSDVLGDDRVIENYLGSAREIIDRSGRRSAPPKRRQPLRASR